MNEHRQRLVMVLLAVVGTAHEIYVRQRIADTVTTPASGRAAQYHAAAQLYGKCAHWFGRQALRAETSYYAELEKQR